MGKHALSGDGKEAGEDHIENEEIKSAEFAVLAGWHGCKSTGLPCEQRDGHCTTPNISTTSDMLLGHKMKFDSASTWAMITTKKWPTGNHSLWKSV